MTSPEQAVRLDTTSSPSLGSGLAVLRDLFDRFHEAGIRYCHWKSNEHLQASFTGGTDVDVLFDRRAIVPLTRILGEADFKRFVVKQGRGYPGIEDYVGFDSSTGALTHLHVHYQLTLGEKFLKGHRLPWEERYLATRVWDAEHELYVADPHLELIALVVRAVMKLRWRDSLLELVGTPYIRGGMLRELRWLHQRVDRNRLLEVATELVGHGAARLLPAMLDAKRPSTGQLRAFGRLARPRLHEYRLFSTADAVRQMMAREWSVVWWKVRNWYLRAPTKSTRTLPHGGLSVAILGADGAGKSTLTGAIAEWLSREVAVVTTYGGSGKGSAAWPRRLLQGIAAGRRRIGKTNGAGPSQRSAHEETSSLRTLGRLIWVWSLVRERQRRARETRRARGLGMVVLSDRFPQSQFPGMNDGPRLSHWLDDRSWLRRWAARHEQAGFQLVELLPPDLLLKLQVSAEVALRRKPETPEAQVRSGIDMVNRLTFPDTTTVVVLNAEQPLASVLLQAKRALWDRL